MTEMTEMMLFKKHLYFSFECVQLKDRGLNNTYK